MICGHKTESLFSIACRETNNLACEGKCWLHCPFTKSIERLQVDLFRNATARWQIDEKWEKLQDTIMLHAIEVHGIPDTRPKVYPNGKYKGPFAFTLTMSPTDGLSVDDMVSACKKVMSQRSQPVKKFAWYLEYKDEETKAHPHIHGMYETEDSTRIQRRTWNRAWKIWNEEIRLGQGFRGGYHRPVRSDEAYNDYIRKQGGIGESNI